MATISVIMSTYREELEYIRCSVESILNQTHTDLELILVPDDPENVSVLILLREYEARDSRVRVLENEKNLGLTGALNKALKEIRGEYIARMDADDISRPERLEVQLQYMKTHGLDLVGARKLCIDEHGTVIENSESTYYTPKVVMKYLRFGDCLPHSTWLAKREVYECLDGYRSMPRSEDYDFLLRALSKNVKMGMCDQVVFEHRINDAGISRSGMLEQLLASWYLLDHFDRIETITSDEVVAHVTWKLTPEDQERYRRATYYFDQAVQIRSARPFKCITLLLKSVIISKCYRRRLVDILRLRWTIASGLFAGWLGRNQT